MVAVKEHDHLIERPDSFIFEVAQSDGRAIVTENVTDFQVLHQDRVEQNLVHTGLIYTTDRTFPRGNRNFVGSMVRALEALLTSEIQIEGQEIWLRPV